MATDAARLVRRYYDALDDHDYETLADVLAPDFAQRRPDRTFESRAAFVRFMRDERPNPETRHELDAIVADDGRAAVRGRVIEESATDGDGERRALFEFADFFELEGDRIGRLETYSR
ncbi:nuclear transport factor 2 family protein [Halosolutus amylolyticus]|uniref:Nuclear transport factor 2 family protein n=1 Tax=Halosolutus amylolyticus TaxID=2932267 RepID=A0ABD5PQG5_9EURY|nr:nuclear transport factor 2 family protein [Halosolutus amylolyticus]